MTEDLWAEQQINRVFKATVDEVGYDRADLAFDEINEYPEDEDRLERTVQVARKLGATLEEQPTSEQLVELAELRDEFGYDYA